MINLSLSSRNCDLCDIRTLTTPRLQKSIDDIFFALSEIILSSMILILSRDLLFIQILTGGIAKSGDIITCSTCDKPVFSYVHVTQIFVPSQYAIVP